MTVFVLTKALQQKYFCPSLLQLTAITTAATQKKKNPKEFDKAPSIVLSLPQNSRQNPL